LSSILNTLEKKLDIENIKTNKSMVDESIKEEEDDGDGDGDYN